MNNLATKKEFRTWAKDIRQTLDLKIISNQIENKIEKLDVYKNSKFVMSYLGTNIEVSLNKLFEDTYKSWFLPVVETCHGKSLHTTSLLVAPYIPGKTKLIKNKFNISEPEINDNFFDQENKKIKLDLIFVPGLCFDKNGNRLGFGAGYYDSFKKPLLAYGAWNLELEFMVC